MTYVHASRYINAVMAFLLLGLFFIAVTTHAQSTYQPLVGIPELEGNNEGLAGYFNRIYVIIIAIGAMVGFLRIAMAGVKWSLSDVVTDKSSARDDIKGSLLGLAILLIPFVVLNTIYPNLTNLNILQGASGVRVDLNAPQPGGPRGTGGSGAPSTDPGTIADPETVIVNQVVENWSCTFVSRGEMIPGTQDDIGGPQYYPDEYNCDRVRDECAARRGTLTQISNGRVQCTYSTGTVRDGIEAPMPGNMPIGA